MLKMDSLHSSSLGSALGLCEERGGNQGRERKSRPRKRPPLGGVSKFQFAPYSAVPSPYAFSFLPAFTSS